MTDKEKLISLLTEFGVGFSEESCDDDSTITCEQGMAKVTGYGGFATMFVFSPSGAFVSMGAWE